MAPLDWQEAHQASENRTLQRRVAEMRLVRQKGRKAERSAGRVGSE